MKEYLINNNGEYKLHQGGVVPDGAIEVPEGTTKVTFVDGVIIFWKDDKFSFSPDDGDKDFSYDPEDHFTLTEYLDRWDGSKIIWKRPTLPEELPLIGDGLLSLNDQYAEIEQVRQSQWAKQVGGNHYKDMPIQPAKFALENKLDYCQANAIKYICRHEHKNGKEDLEKAKHYIDLLIEHHYG